MPSAGTRTSWLIVGFDDITLAPHCFPPLTIVRGPLAELGAQAADQLLRQIERVEAPSGLSHHLDNTSARCRLSEVLPFSSPG